MAFGISAGAWLAAGAVVGGSLIAKSGASKAADAQTAATGQAVAQNDRQIVEAQRQYDLTRADQLKLYDQNRTDQLGLLERNRTDQLGLLDRTRTDQLGLLDRSRTDQLAQLQQTRDDLAPYRGAGTTALARLMSGSAPGGEFEQNYQRGAFEADPGYAFRQSEGEKSIQRAASARGGLYSGATLKALSRFNSGLASQEYGAFDTRQNTKENQFNLNRDFRRNNLASLAGIGQTATRDVANAGAGATGAIGQAGQSAYGAIGAGGQSAYGAIGAGGQSAYGAIGAGGQSAYGTIAGAGGALQGSIGSALQSTGQALIGAGDARASGYVAGSNALGGALKGLYNGYTQSQMLSRPDYPNFSPGYGIYDTGTPGNVVAGGNTVANGGWGIE